MGVNIDGAKTSKLETGIIMAIVAVLFWTIFFALQYDREIQAEKELREVIIPIGSQQGIPANVTYKFANYQDGAVVIGLDNYYAFLLEGASESESFQILENQTEINYSVNGISYHVKIYQ